MGCFILCLWHKTNILFVKLYPLWNTAAALNNCHHECSSSQCRCMVWFLWGCTAVANTTATLSPVGGMMTMTNLGGCPPEFHATGLYEAGDCVSINNNISWPQSMFCSQIGFEPSLTSVDSNWKQAWQIVGYCTPGAVQAILDGCPAGAGQWVFGNHNTYKENDQVSVTRSTGTPPKLVNSLYTCKPWPYSGFCAMFSPIDINGGHLGWKYGGDCNGTVVPNYSIPTIAGGCPNDYNAADAPIYKAGS